MSTNVERFHLASYVACPFWVSDEHHSHVRWVGVSHDPFTTLHIELSLISSVPHFSHAKIRQICHVHSVSSVLSSCIRKLWVAPVGSFPRSCAHGHVNKKWCNHYERCHCRKPSLNLAWITWSIVIKCHYVKYIQIPWTVIRLGRQTGIDEASMLEGIVTLSRIKLSTREIHV